MWACIPLKIFFSLPSRIDATTSVSLMNKKLSLILSTRTQNATQPAWYILSNDSSLNNLFMIPYLYLGRFFSSLTVQQRNPHYADLCSCQLNVCHFLQLTLLKWACKQVICHGNIHLILSWIHCKNDGHDINCIKCFIHKK